MRGSRGVPYILGGRYSGGVSLGGPVIPWWRVSQGCHHIIFCVVVFHSRLEEGSGSWEDERMTADSTTMLYRALNNLIER